MSDGAQFFIDGCPGRIKSDPGGGHGGAFRQLDGVEIFLQLRNGKAASFVGNDRGTDHFYVLIRIAAVAPILASDGKYLAFRIGLNIKRVIFLREIFKGYHLVKKKKLKCL